MSTVFFVVICQLFSSVVGSNGHHLITCDIEWRDLVIVVAKTNDKILLLLARAIPKAC